MKLHSVVDVITNSSTELFVVDKPIFDIELVMWELAKIWSRKGRTEESLLKVFDVTEARFDYFQAYEFDENDQPIPYQSFRKGNILVRADDSSLYYYNEKYDFDIIDEIEEALIAKRYHLG